MPPLREITQCSQRASGFGSKDNQVNISTKASLPAVPTRRTTRHQTSGCGWTGKKGHGEQAGNGTHRPRAAGRTIPGRGRHGSAPRESLLLLDQILKERTCTVGPGHPVTHPAVPLGSAAYPSRSSQSSDPSWPRNTSWIYVDAYLMNILAFEMMELETES